MSRLLFYRLCFTFIFSLHRLTIPGSYLTLGGNASRLPRPAARSDAKVAYPSNRVLPRNPLRAVLTLAEDAPPCDWVAYLARYPDLADQGVLTAAQAMQHYENEGKAQGRQCLSVFRLMGLDSFRARNSSCSGAIDLFATYDPQPQQGQSQPSNSLKLVNLGSGTTGTRFLFKVICDELHLQGLHWWSACTSLDDAYNPLAYWWEYIRHCTEIEATPAAQHICKTSVALKMLDYEVKRLVNEVQVLSDSPIDVIYAEYAWIMQHALFVQTLRDPKTWATKRLAQHPGHTIMCKPSVHASSGARHAFDIPACLKSSEYINEALMVETNSQRLAKGYIEMNTYNAKISKNLHIMCLWDESPTDAKIELALAWNLFSSNP